LSMPDDMKLRAERLGISPEMLAITPEEMAREMEKHRQRMEKMADDIAAKTFRAQHGAEIAFIELRGRSGAVIRRIPQKAGGA